MKIKKQTVDILQIIYLIISKELHPKQIMKDLGKT